MQNALVEDYVNTHIEDFRLFNHKEIDVSDTLKPLFEEYILETVKKSFRHSRVGGNPGRRACCLGPRLHGDDRYLQYL